MPTYFVAIHHPDDYDPVISEDHAMGRQIDLLNQEMVAAGIRVFVGGLTPAHTAQSIVHRSDSRLEVLDGPYLKTREHVAGFWVLQAMDREEALTWGKKAATACRASVEVRQFN